MKYEKAFYERAWLLKIVRKESDYSSLTQHFFTIFRLGSFFSPTANHSPTVPTAAFPQSCLPSYYTVVAKLFRYR